MTVASVEGQFTAAGQVSSPVQLEGYFNVSVSGFGAATVGLERSFDGGTSWRTVESYTSNTDKVGHEPEVGILYRLNATAYTSGPISYRLSF